MNSLVIRFAWWDLAVGGNFLFCLIIVVIFIGLGRAYRLGGILESQSHHKFQLFQLSSKIGKEFETEI